MDCVSLVYDEIIEDLSFSGDLVIATIGVKADPISDLCPSID